MPDMPEHGRARGEGENLIERIKRHYVPPKKLRRKHTMLIKMIKSVEQGRNGKELACVFCKFVAPIEKMQLNHINGNTEDNRLENLEPCDQECNNADHHRRRIARALHGGIYVRERELKQSEHTQEGHASEIMRAQYNSREGAKHEIMRPRYDTWIRDQVNGAFAQRYSWPKELLAEAAPYACSLEPGKAFGSSKTYVKFINEDIAGGILKAEAQEGITIVFLNGDYLKRIQEQLGS